jgi:hypothetical protein
MIQPKALSHQTLATALLGAVTLAFTTGSSAADSELAKGTSNQQARTMKIRMTVEGTVITAMLFDNPTSRDFASMLPLVLTLNDYAATEKISDLPRRLTARDAPAGIDPSAGDITYYAPWGNLAVFYRDFNYSKGLVKLGKIDSDVEALRRPGPLRATVDLMEN